MSSLPVGGILPGVAGTGLAQTSASDSVRAKQDAAVQRRQAASELQAEDAAGIGKTDGDEHSTNDRDADGRMFWHFGPPPEEAAAEGVDAAQAPPPHPAPHGDTGSQLDLTG